MENYLLFNILYLSKQEKLTKRDVNSYDSFCWKRLGQMLANNVLISFGIDDLWRKGHVVPSK